MTDPLTPVLSTLDHEAFGDVVEPYRRELHVHCYRMLGSLHDAEDAVQDALLRAWNRRATYAGRASVRAWLYGIATHACLDRLRQRRRRYVPRTREGVSAAADPIPPNVTEPIWLEPYPDDRLPAPDMDPEARWAAREQITLAFTAALHLLPPRQRAFVILSDVLEFDAREIAAALDTTVAAVKSGLHRARATLSTQPHNLRDLPLLEADWAARLDAYVRAWETGDVEGLIGLLHADATFSMPPIPSWYQGRDEIAALTRRTIFAGQAQGRWMLRPTRANGQIAFGVYRQSAAGGYDAYGVQVLTFRDGLISDIITFRIPTLVDQFGLPASLPR